MLPNEKKKMKCNCFQEFLKAKLPEHQSVSSFQIQIRNQMTTLISKTVIVQVMPIMSMKRNMAFAIIAVAEEVRPVKQLAE